jgi:hypothetical protein
LKISNSAVALALSILASTPAWANDIDPFGFEKEHFIASRSRADVVADLQAAQAAGQLPVAGEVGVRFAEAPSTKPRAQVVAETREAARLGLLSYGEAGPKQATPAQERQIELAGIQAVAHLAAAKSTSSRSGG